MASGDLINYSALAYEYYRDFSIMDIDSGSDVGHKYVYVSAQSWYAQITINKNWGSWGRDISFTASYWNGSAWVEAWSDSHSWGQFESGEWTYKYYHNSTLGTTSGDVVEPVLWELHFYYPELYRKRLRLYVGRIACMGEELYNNFYKGRKIYHTGAPGQEYAYKEYNVESRSTALSYFSQSAYTGNIIRDWDSTVLTAYKFS